MCVCGLGVCVGEAKWSFSLRGPPLANTHPAQATRISMDANLLTPEQREQLKKERARVYSMRARRRQERYMAELKASVDVLMVFRYLVDCGPDLVLCLSREGADSTVLYANAIALRALGGGRAEDSPDSPDSVIGR